MKIRKFILFTILIFPILNNGCDSGTQTTQVQDIVELKWQNDGSALFGFIQSYSLTATSAIPGIGYSIAKFNTDGSLAQTYSTDPKSRPDFSNSLFISSDGSTAVTQLENDLYRYNMKTGALEKLQTLFHLIVVSPDMHYAVGSPSPANQPQKTVNVYDLTVSPIRLATHFDVPGLANATGVWLTNNRFGLSVNDSVGEHISIFDINSVGSPIAIPINVISGVQLRFHNFVFDSVTNDLFVRDIAGKSTDYFIDKFNLTTNSRVNILNFKVNNFDVTKDEKVIIYSADDTNHTVLFKSRNLITLNENSIASDIRLIISLSPTEDKLAYIRERDLNFTEVKVIPFSRP